MKSKDIVLSILIGTTSKFLSVLFVSPQWWTVCINYVRPGWTTRTGAMWHEQYNIQTLSMKTRYTIHSSFKKMYIVCIYGQVKVTHTIHWPTINIVSESVKDINRLTVTEHRPCQKQATSMTKYNSIIIAYTKRIMIALDKLKFNCKIKNVNIIH